MTFEMTVFYENDLFHFPMLLLLMCVHPTHVHENRFLERQHTATPQKTIKKKRALCKISNSKFDSKKLG